jgi:hypothetical protein
VDYASPVGVDFMISWQNNRKVKYPMLVIVVVVMVMVVMVMVVMVTAVMMMVMVVEMTIEKWWLMERMQYEKVASFCNSILHTVTPASHHHNSALLATVQCWQP